jgi:hypothetical protein
VKNDLLINELAETLSLDGLWDFRLGKDSDWRIIQVPGCWEKQGSLVALEKANPQISNPHLIFPGQEIVIS